MKAQALLANAVQAAASAIEHADRAEQVRSHYSGAPALEAEATTLAEAPPKGVRPQCRDPD